MFQEITVEGDNKLRLDRVVGATGLIVQSLYSWQGNKWQGGLLAMSIGLFSEQSRGCNVSIYPPCSFLSLFKVKNDPGVPFVYAGNFPEISCDKAYVSLHHWCVGEAGFRYESEVMHY